MSTEVNKAFVQQFSDNLVLLSQQKGSRLAGTVMRRSLVGKFDHFERLGLQTATERTSRHQDTPLNDTPHSRRRVILRDFEAADLIDRQDDLRMLIDPKSSYAITMAFALGRRLDDLIIDAADGNASSIDATDTSSDIALPASQRIDEDFNTADSDIIVEKVIEAKRILFSNEVDPDEDFFFVLDSTALHNLLQETEIGSFDFNSVKALVDGKINTWMGFKFVHSERLNLVSGELFLQCLAYAGSGIGLSMGQEIEVKMAERADKAHSLQVYASMSAGAVRVEEEKVVVVEAFRS